MSEQQPLATPGGPQAKDEEFWRHFLEEVNVAARLASLAETGEALISADAAAASDLDPALARQTLDLKGKSLGTEVVSVRISRG